MVEECGAQVLMTYKNRMIEKLEDMPGISIDCDALMRGNNIEALEKAKSNPNSLFNLINAQMVK